MSRLPGFVTIGSVVSNVMNDLYQDADEGRRIQYGQFAIKGYKDLRLTSLENVDTAKLDMNTVGKVSLPGDYISFIAIGIPFQGKVWTFTRESMIIIPMGQVSGAEEFNVGEGEGVSIDPDGAIVGYGARGGKNQYYVMLDEENGTIVINGFPRCKVTLKYIGTGVNIGTETMIPGIAEEALIAYIHMRRLRYDKNASRTDKEYALSDYDKACEKLRALTAPSIEELMDAVYSANTQSLKR